MKIKKIIIAAIVGTISLFLFDGAFQAIPNFGVRAVERVESNELTTSRFNELTNKMTYIASDKTVSFVAVKHADYYKLSRFFVVEFISASIIALVFALVFGKIRFYNLRERLLLAFAFTIVASFAIHIPYFNWWGFSLSYTLGVISKTVLGWVLIAFIQNRFIYKIK